jgi:hypothetical protein
LAQCLHKRNNLSILAMKRMLLEFWMLIHPLEKIKPVVLAKPVVACTTTKSGYYSDSLIWSCGKVPKKMDDIYIRTGDTLRLNRNEDANSVNFAFGSFLEINTFTIKAWKPN